MLRLRQGHNGDWIDTVQQIWVSLSVSCSIWWCILRSGYDMMTKLGHSLSEPLPSLFSFRIEVTQPCSCYYFPSTIHLHEAIFLRIPPWRVYPVYLFSLPRWEGKIDSLHAHSSNGFSCLRERKCYALLVIHKLNVLLLVSGTTCAAGELHWWRRPQEIAARSRSDYQSER